MNASDDMLLWEDIHAIAQCLYTEIMHLWQRISAKDEVLKQALETPHLRGTALRLLFLLCDEKKIKVFQTLMDLASVGHSDIALCRSIIKSMPSQWVIQNIEPIAQSILKSANGEEEYRRLAELYLELDKSLLERHIREALAHTSEEIREVGADFQQYL